MEKSHGGARPKITTQRSPKEKNDTTQPTAENEGKEKNMSTAIFTQDNDKKIDKKKNTKIAEKVNPKTEPDPSTTRRRTTKEQDSANSVISEISDSESKHNGDRMTNPSPEKDQCFKITPPTKTDVKIDKDIEGEEKKMTFSKDTKEDSKKKADEEKVLKTCTSTNTVDTSTQSDDDHEKTLSSNQVSTCRHMHVRDATSLKLLSRTNPDYPSITFHNTTSVKTKLDKLNEENFNTDIIAICETWLKSDHTNRTLNDEYEGFFCDRKVGEKKRGGGCAIWLRKSDCTNREIVFTDTGTDEMQIESLCVKLKYKKEKFAVLIIYNPPGSNQGSRSSYNAKLVKKMFEDCKKHMIPAYNFIVMGDFNRTTLGTTRQLGSEERRFTLYGEGKSKLDQIYGTNPQNPYKLRLIDPNEYNKNYTDKKKEEHMIIQLY